MSIIFSYNESITYWIESIITACILIIVNIFIRKSGKNQPEGVKYSNLLVLASSINIIILIMRPLFPYLSISKYTQNEYLIFKLYNSMIQLIVPITSLFTFGVFFIIFGSKNRDQLTSAPLTAGIAMTINNFIQIITVLFFWTILIDYYIYNPGFSIHGDPLWATYLILINFPITTNLVGIIILLVHGKFNKDKYLFYAMSLTLFHFIVIGNLYWILRTVFGTSF